jgi:hypothetical protein
MSWAYDDAVDREARLALQQMTPQLRQLQHENQRLAQRVAQHDAQTIYSVLDASEFGSTWRDINVSPEFVAFLALPDLYSGQVRAGMLRAAFGRGEAGRVLAIFRDFVSQYGAARPQQSSRRQSAEPAFVTNRDLDAHYEKARTGGYATEQQKNAAEAALMAAVNAGRFRRVP